MMRKRTIIVVLLVLVVVIMISLTALTLWKNNQTPPVETIPAIKDSGSTDGTFTPTPEPTATVRTNAELIDNITKQDSSLLDANQQPIFGITKSVKTPSNWYVVTIINKDDPTVGSAKIIMKDSGSAGIVLVAGPGTSFSRDDFTFPDDVWKLL